jgi:hypothetical protein
MKTMLTYERYDKTTMKIDDKQITMTSPDGTCKSVSFDDLDFSNLLVVCCMIGELELAFTKTFGAILNKIDEDKYYKSQFQEWKNEDTK